MGEDSGETDREQSVEELLRINAELAAEIRSLNLGRRDSPRSGQLPAARKLAQLKSERDKVSEELRVTTAERDALLKHKEPLEAEVARLRSGLLGFLRRARARLLGS